MYDQSMHRAVGKMIAGYRAFLEDYDGNVEKWAKLYGEAHFCAPCMEVDGRCSFCPLNSLMPFPPCDERDFPESGCLTKGFHELRLALKCGNKRQIQAALKRRYKELVAHVKRKGFAVDG